MAYPPAIIIFLALATMFTGFVVKSDVNWDGPYDSVVNKLCDQFKHDRDIHLYMQGLSVDRRDQFYFVYRDQVYYMYHARYNYQNKRVPDNLWPKRPDYNYMLKKLVDPLVSLGKWNEIPWIKTILDQNGIDGNSSKLIRFRIYSIPGDDDTNDAKIEISFQRSGEDKVETLITKNGTSQVKFVANLTEWSIYSHQRYYIFRYDNQGRVILLWRYYESLMYRIHAPIEKGPFYVHVGQREDKSQIVSFHANAPPSPYNPLFAQLPIYGWMVLEDIFHLWDLPNHRVLHFVDPILRDKYEADLGTYEFEKYFDCEDGSSKAIQGDEPQAWYLNPLLYMAVIISGLIALALVVTIVYVIVKRKRKNQRKARKPRLLSVGSSSIKQSTSASKNGASKGRSSSKKNTSSRLM